MFLKRTIEDILKHREADTEVIAVLDGEWADNVHLLKAEIPIGSTMAIGYNHRCSEVLDGMIVYLPNRLILLEQLM